MPVERSGQINEFLSADSRTLKRRFDYTTIYLTWVKIFDWKSFLKSVLKLAN